MKKTNTWYSWEYLDQQGTLLNTYLKKFTLRVNTDFNYKNNFHFGENIQLSYTDNHHIGIYTNTWTDKESALKAIRYEKMLELGMEGHRFFDLVRWGIAEQEINAFLDREKTIKNVLVGAHFKPGMHEYFPIPQRQIDLSAGADGVPKMKQNPGY